MLTGKKFMFLVLFAALVSFSSCSSSDDGVTSTDDPIDDPTAVQMGHFTLSNTPLVGNMVFVENFTIPGDGWIVVRRDDGHNSPMMSEIISIPEFVLAGSYTEYSIQLEGGLDLHHGEKLWVNLHADDGDQVFSYTGSNDADMPLGIFNAFGGYTLIANSFVVDLND